MLYFLMFAAGMVVGGVGVVMWFSCGDRSDAPEHLADILRDDPTVTGRRDTRRNYQNS